MASARQLLKGTEKWQRRAMSAAQKARIAAVAAAKQADKLYMAARSKAMTAARRRKIKRVLMTTGRVLRAAGRAAVVAAVAAGLAAGRAELNRRVERAVRKRATAG